MEETVDSRGWGALPGKLLKLGVVASAVQSAFNLDPKAAAASLPKAEPKEEPEETHDHLFDDLMGMCENPEFLLIGGPASSLSP